VKRAIFVAIVIGLPILLVGLVYRWVDDKINGTISAIVDGKLGFASRQVADTVHDAASTSWIALAIGMGVLIILAGWLCNKEYFGALIDQQNRYSLARLQVAAWTTVVLSAWLAVVLVRIASDISVGNALKVEIPDAVLVTLGISVGSFAFSSGIKDSKRKQSVSSTFRVQLERDLQTLTARVQQLTTDLAHSTAAAAVAAGDEKAALDMAVSSLKVELDARTVERDEITKQLDAIKSGEGLLAKNSSPADARASDFFRGDEIADAQTLDFAKVQMLWITVAVVAAYVFILSDALTGFDLFRGGSDGVSLPDLPDSVVALLAISHSGYLAVKASNSQKPEGTP